MLEITLRGHVLMPGDLFGGQTHQAPPQSGHSQFVSKRSHRGQRAFNEVTWFTEDIHDPHHAGSPVDQRTGSECPQIEAFFIQESTRFRVSVEKHLKPSVQQKSIQLIGPHPSTDAVASLEDERPGAGFMQAEGTSQTGQSAAHDQHLFLRRAHGRNSIRVCCCGKSFPVEWATRVLQSRSQNWKNPPVANGRSRRSFFNTANWGKLVFDHTDLLAPIPAGKGVLFVASDGETLPNADLPIIEYIQSKGYVVTSFTSDGSTPEGLLAATAGQSVVLISETIGSTSVVDPPGVPTGIFSLQNTDIPVISCEAFMYDNAQWVNHPEDFSNDFINFGNTGRGEVAETPVADGRDSLYVRKADHPIVKGLTGKVQVYNELYSLNWGIPSVDADIVASVEPDGSYPTIFVYEKGDKLPDGSTVPNKRIGFYLGQNAAPDFNTPVDWSNVTETGKTILANTLAFAIGSTQPVTPTLSAVRDGNSLRVTYAGGTLQSASTLTNPTWVNESVASGGSLAITGPAKFLRVRGN